MIVHKDLGVSQFLKKVVEIPDVNYSIANNYDDLKNSMLNNSYDVILTDISIQGNYINNYIEYIKLKAPNTAILVFSEMNQIAIKSSIKKMGIDDFIPLPFDIIDLKERLSKHL